MKRRFIPLLLVLLMILTMAGCKSVKTNNDKIKGSGTSSNEKVKLTWGFTKSDYGPDKKNWPTEIFKGLAAATNIDLEFKGWIDDQSFQIALAGGDLPDIITAQNDALGQLLKGGLMMPMDDYLKEAPDLVSLSKLRIAAMRKYYSNDDGKLYFWTPQVGQESLGKAMWNGMNIRWDYYKELGYPEVKTEDGFLNIVKQEVQKHPTTPDGKKVFGVGTFSDNGLWGWWIRGCMYGYHNVTNNGYMLRVSDNQIISNYLDFDSPTWRDINYYWKANQMGIFDPDSFTQKGTDYDLKASNGQYISTNCTWYGGNLTTNMKQKDPNTIAQFMVVPVEGQTNWASSVQGVGWSFYIGMTKNCKYPKQAMQLFNFLNTPEGCRLCYSGIKGTHWGIVDGKPQILPAVIEMQKQGGDKWAQFGSGIWDGILGIPHSTECSDGGYTDLWYERSNIIPTLTAAEKDYSSHYGVEIPSDEQEKLIKDGKQFDKSKMLNDLIALMPTTPDDIKRIDGKCDDIMIKAVPKLVLAKNMQEFNQQRDAVIADLKSVGIDKSVEWWTKNSKEVKTFIESNQ